ncbi:hypothetical protein WL99_22225 [Burkholderia cepacia]|nr:hypothetical protein WL99_22225 [Burkholderia cepacia]
MELPPSADAVLVPRLFVLVVIELRPVDSEPIELVADERPVEADVDSEVIELLADERPVEVEVDKLVMLDVVVLATA